MPPPVPRPGGRFRRFLITSLLLILCTAVYAFFSIGQWLSPEQPLMRADAIFVFAGTIAERPLEAVDLYRAGYAPLIVITRDMGEAAASVAEQRGAPVPSKEQLTTEMMKRLGVPEDALVVPSQRHDSTAAEAKTLRDLAVQRGWKRVIVVSSKYHLRRVSVACHQALRGTNVDLIFHATRYDRSSPQRWWSRRSDIRWIFSELPKLAAYSLGLGA